MGQLSSKHNYPNNLLFSPASPQVWIFSGNFKWKGKEKIRHIKVLLNPSHSSSLEISFLFILRQKPTPINWGHIHCLHYQEYLSFGLELLINMKCKENQTFQSSSSVHALVEEVFQREKNSHDRVITNEKLPFTKVCTK